MYTVSLIKRPKIKGIGEHFAVQFNQNQVLDIQLTGLKTITIEEFSHNGKYQVTTELTRTLTVEEFNRQVANLKRFKYSFFGGNCEHWARQFVEGKFESKQINGLAVISLLALIVFGLS